MLEQMRQLISSAALLPPGSHVLCAVSGGADSVCLQHALYHLQPSLKFSLSAAHYDHGLRGEDSTRDAKFVEQFVSLCCEAQRLPDGRVLPPVQLYQAKGDVGKEAARTGHGVEETGPKFLIGAPQLGQLIPSPSLPFATMSTFCMYTSSVS